jgi:hypothetical protein
MLCLGIAEKDITFSPLGDMVHVSMPIKTANAALKTEFALFRSAVDSNVAIPRITKPYFLPEQVAKQVLLVSEIVRFPAIRAGPQPISSELKTAGDDEFNSCGTKCNGYTTVRTVLIYLSHMLYLCCILISTFSPNPCTVLHYISPTCCPPPTPSTT